ncbi:MAG: class I SAM-dependent methyltransferase [Thermoleophilia bacterium]|nr:class I SAM-dependent methyltransferase [Thermoleophilia bacterium]
MRRKPFGHAPDETARLLIDAALIVSLLELHAGTSLCELGCGSGWLSRLFARHGVRAVGYDISPAMIEIAREEAAREGLAEAVRYEVADMEELVTDEQFDACLLYDALHHSARPQLVLRSARRALRPGGRLLISEPNWMHRFGGRSAAQEHGVTEAGYSPRRLKRLLRDAGFGEIERLHRARRSVFGNRPLDVARHLGGPLVVRALAPFWAETWLRARAA